MIRKKGLRNYFSLILLFVPAILFGLLLLLYRDNDRLRLSNHFPYVIWQFYAIGLFGIVATAGAILDWQYYRITRRI